MSPRNHRPGRPTDAGKLQRHDAQEELATGAAGGDVWPDQHQDSTEADEETADEARCQRLAVRRERLDADHPERYRRHSHGGDSARHPLLRPDDAPVTDTHG